MRHVLPSLVLAGVALAAPASLRADDLPPPSVRTAPKDLVATAVAAGSFTTFVKAVQAAGLVATLEGPGPFTVFAPTDAAFERLPAGGLEVLLSDPAALKRVLTYHVVAGRVRASAAAGLRWVETVEGRSARIRVVDGAVRVDEARVLTADVPASNGVLHVIDAVLLPRDDLLATAVAAGSFRTLVRALEAAGLADALKGKGPFTVFAPTDEAFAKLPPGTLDALLRDKAALTGILTYHVLPARVLSSDFPEGTTTARTLDGRPVAVTRSKEGAVTVGGARVVGADVLAGNGIVHAIDTVVLPR